MSASGFFEWKPTGRGRQPYAVRLKDTDLFAFAGLWELWIGPNCCSFQSACENHPMSEALLDDFSA